MNDASDISESLLNGKLTLNQRKQMKNIIKQNSFTLIFMFIIIFFIIIISAIYVIIYYYIYKHLQTRLILWFLIIFVISFIFSFFISLSISICRYLSIIYKIKSLYMPKQFMLRKSII